MSVTRCAVPLPCLPAWGGSSSCSPCLSRRWPKARRSAAPWRTGTGNERTPVEGVVITVSQDGTEIATATSDAEGAWEVPLPGAGTYQVSLDVATLPDGVRLTDPSRAELPNVEVIGGQQKVVLFPLEEGQGGGGGGGGTGGGGGGGTGGGGGVSAYARVGGLLVAGLKLGATIALAAVGLSLIYAVTGLVNFAHAELVTLGAVLAFAFHVAGIGPGMPLVLAAIPAIILVGAFGWVQSRYLWLPLRRRRTSLLSMMVVSIGLSFALRSLIQLFFGGQPISYQDFAGQPGVPILGISMVPKHLVTIGVSVLVLLLVTQFLERSRAGTAMRAVADDQGPRRVVGHRRRPGHRPDLDPGGRACRAGWHLLRAE